MSEIVSQTMELTNKPYGCTVLIDLKGIRAELPEGLTSVRIKRKTDKDAVWKTIYTHSVATVDDLTVTLEDRNTVAGKTYIYAAIPVFSNVEGIGVTGEIKTRFKGWYVADSTAEYELGLNVTFSKRKNTSLAYIQTLGSKYPYAISNGNLNYYTGNFSALFLPKNETGEFTREGAYEFKQAALEFLSNGKTKILKSYEGEAMKIRVDDAVELEQSEYEDAASIRFSFTEVGAFPEEGLVKKND